jgi:hypothetical protein
MTCNRVSTKSHRATQKVNTRVIAVFGEGREFEDQAGGHRAAVSGDKNAFDDARFELSSGAFFTWRWSRSVVLARDVIEMRML